MFSLNFSQITFHVLGFFDWRVNRHVTRMLQSLILCSCHMNLKLKHSEFFLSWIPSVSASSSFTMSWIVSGGLFFLPLDFILFKDSAVIISMSCPCEVLSKCLVSACSWPDAQTKGSRGHSRPSTFG